MARSIKEKEISPSLNEAISAIKEKITNAEAVFDLNQCPASLYLKEKAISGRASCISQMIKISQWISDYNPKDKSCYLRIPWHKLNVEDVQWIRIAYQERGYSPATTALAISTIKGIIKQSWVVGWVDDKQWIRVRDMTFKKNKTKTLAGRELSTKEIKKVITACNDGTAWGARDMAILSILSGTGMRRTTIAQVEIKGLRDDDTVICTKVKGGQTHEHPLPDGCQLALEAWFKFRGRSGQYLFNPINKKGEIDTSTGLSGQGIYRLIQKRIRIAGIADATPHDFRRSFITDLIRQYGLSIAQDFAGHASPETTKKYDRSKFEERIKIAHNINIPFVDDDDSNAL